jgi:hypothetical protein
MDQAQQLSDEALEQKLQDRADADKLPLIVTTGTDPEAWVASMGKLTGHGPTRRQALDELHRGIAQADLIGTA